MMKIHKHLILIALISVWIFGGQSTMNAQNVTVPREPTPPGSDSPKQTSQTTRILLDIVGAVARVICEDLCKCPPTTDTPAESESRTRREFGRTPTLVGTPTSQPADPGYNSQPRRSFSFLTPTGWNAYEESSSVTVAAPSEYINGNLANGVIFGLFDLNGASFESGSDRYVRAILSANKYLKRVGRPESSVSNAVPCITTRLGGPSRHTGYTENVVIYTCHRNAQNLLYVVNVTSGPNANRYEVENNRVIQSLNFR